MIDKTNPQTTNPAISPTKIALSDCNYMKLIKQ